MHERIIPMEPKLASCIEEAVDAFVNSINKDGRIQYHRRFQDAQVWIVSREKLYSGDVPQIVTPRVTVMPYSNEVLAIMPDVVVIRGGSRYILPPDVRSSLATDYPIFDMMQHLYQGKPEGELTDKIFSALNDAWEKAQNIDPDQYELH